MNGIKSTLHPLLGSRVEQTTSSRIARRINLLNRITVFSSSIYLFIVIADIVSHQRSLVPYSLSAALIYLVFPVASFGFVFFYTLFLKDQAIAVEDQLETSIQRLKQNEISTRNLIEALPDLVLVINRNGVFMSYHRPPEVEFIVPPEKFVGANYHDCLPAHVAACFDSAWDPLFKLRTPQTISYPMTRSNGTVEHFETRLVLTADDKVLALAQNVTKRVRSQQALQESERLFRQIVETTSEGIIMLDENDLITFSNLRMGEILGYSVADVVGSKPHKFVSPDFLPLLELKLKNRRQGIRESYDCKYLRSDGTPAWVLISSSPILDDEGQYRGNVALHVDITDRKRMETEIVSNSKMSALGVMSSGIAHEINNPLTIIHGRAGQLRQMALRGKIDATHVASYSEKIEKTAMRITAIVKALQSFSRESSYDPLQTCSLISIISETLELCQERFRANGIHLQVDSTLDSVLIDCRPGQISQIILNLLNNSFDAIEKLHERWVRVAIMRRVEGVEVSVTDSGRGIPPELHEKILQPFFTTKDVGRGTGLGLSVSKGLAESHGGRLYLDTQSTFTRFVLVFPPSKNQSSGQRFSTVVTPNAQVNVRTTETALPL